jgi:hypothetical protein
MAASVSIGENGGVCCEAGWRGGVMAAAGGGAKKSKSKRQQAAALKISDSSASGSIAAKIAK